MDCGPQGSSVHGESPGKNTVVCCLSFSRGSLALECSGSVIVVQGLTCPVACEIFQTRVQTMYPALRGGFLTSGPPGKPRPHFLSSSLELTFNILSTRDNVLEDVFCYPNIDQRHFIIHLHNNSRATGINFCKNPE